MCFEQENNEMLKEANSSAYFLFPPKALQCDSCDSFRGAVLLSFL